ncbi:MAG: glycoside hydrolase family 3 protein [Spirochaetales bacterium]|nr:glycoside hydrolase family 3 protein [Spirochaetales bacterium]
METDMSGIKTIIAKMTTEEKVAHIVMPQLPSFTKGPHDQFAKRFETLLGFIETYGIGGVFIIRGDPSILKQYVRDMRETAPNTGVLIAADLENGAGRFEGNTQFPDLLALGAADDPDLAYTMGKAAALEGKRMGINWSFSPVVDIILNPDNPITQNRALGDKEDRIAVLAAAFIRGMQEHGMAACAKHFPGDGTDSLDQHVATAMNSLSKPEWLKHFGAVYKHVIKAGVLSIMIGHIALPFQDGRLNKMKLYYPATLSKNIITDLLKTELGFNGLVISDAMGMAGVTGSMIKQDRLIASLNAGCDMLLFVEEKEITLLMEAAIKGKIEKSRLDQAVEKVLLLKKTCGVLANNDFSQNKPDDNQGPAEKQEFLNTAGRIAEKAVVIVRNMDNTWPVSLAKEANILTITLSRGNDVLTEIDPALKQRGFSVDHLLNPPFPLFPRMENKYDFIFVNFNFPVEWATASCKCIGPQNRIFMYGFTTDYDGKIMYTSFGSPFHLREIPHLPNYINVHSDCSLSQHAAVKAWFGELDISHNTSPVNIMC